MTKLSNSGWIPYQIRINGTIQEGRCNLASMHNKLKEFESAAKDILNNSEDNIKHILYAVRYDPNTYREETQYHLYLVPMTEDFFERHVVGLPDARIYALHR